VNGVNRKLSLRLTVAVAVLGVSTAATGAPTSTAAAAMTRLAATPPVEQAKALVAKMTLDEKIAQLHGIQTSTEYRTVPAVSRLGIPKLLLTNGPAGVSTGGVTQP